MPVLGITGGIATGKSSFVRALVACFSKQATSSISVLDTSETPSKLDPADPESVEALPSSAVSSSPIVPVPSAADQRSQASLPPGLILFDADASAHELLAGDGAVREQIVQAFGPGVLGETGWPERPRLRDVVYSHPSARQQLEAILHPVIRAQWEALATTYNSRPEWLLVDIPLLYETEAHRILSRVVVVACSPATQLTRLREHRKLAENTITSILAAQFDLEVKVTAAQHVVWNDSSLACLHRQASLLADSLRYLYG